MITPVRIAVLLPFLALVKCTGAEILRVPSEFPTIAAALAWAADGDEIVLADGVYEGFESRNLDLPPISLTIRSETGPDTCAISGSFLDRIFVCGEGVDATIRGISLIDGYVEDWQHLSTPQGGGLVVQSGGSMHFTDCAFRNSTNYGECDSRGGAVAVRGGLARFERCVFEDNRVFGGLCGPDDGSGFGGAIYALGATLEIIGCEFRNNRAVFGAPCWPSRGGAIYASGTSVYLADTMFMRNEGESNAAAYLSGGDIRLIGNHIERNETTVRGPSCGGTDTGALHAQSTGNLFVANCRIINNSTRVDDRQTRGAGAYLKAPNVQVFNSVFAGNYMVAPPCGGGGGRGGNLMIEGTDADLHHVTIGGGRAPCGGSGIYADVAGSLSLIGSIVYGNEGSGSEQIVLLSPQPVRVEYSLIQGGWSGEGNIDADPQFVDPDGRDYTLMPASPAIDAASTPRLPRDLLDLDGDGDLTEPLPVDLVGAPRRLDDPSVPDSGEGPAPLPDMGSLERVPHCRVDLDGDGQLTIFDFLTFQDHFQDGDLRADFDADGTLTLFDFLAFQTAFDAGCQ